MKYTALVSVLALAMTVTASPVEHEERWGSKPKPKKVNNNNGNQCASGNAPICCVGNDKSYCHVTKKSCSGGEVFCCNTNAPEGTLVNVQVLNCATIGGDSKIGDITIGPVGNEGPMPPRE